MPDQAGVQARFKSAGIALLVRQSPRCGWVQYESAWAMTDSCHVQADLTLRFVGVSRRGRAASNGQLMVVVTSGLVLGEGTACIHALP